jgi:hypothetical protein
MLSQMLSSKSFRGFWPSEWSLNHVLGSAINPAKTYGIAANAPNFYFRSRRHSGHDRTCGWFDLVANDPGCVKTTQLI